MTVPIPISQRATASTTTLGALTIFVPLFAVLMWWAFEHRVAYVPAGQFLADGTLRASTAIIAAGLAAGGPSVVVALVLANQRRLKTTLRRSRGRNVTAVALTLLTPVFTLDWFPIFFGFWALVALGSGPWFYWFVVPAVFAIATLAWSLLVSLIVSGVRRRGLRFAVFALVWWSAYGIDLLIFGYHSAAY